MRKLKLLACYFTCALAVFSGDTSARVTKEVAEAVLPYLMEAAGIPQTQQTSDHQAAVISMIYTDEGQQQMVKWVRTGEFPQKLKKSFGDFNSYGNRKYRKASLASLFPCLTGTFTSFSNSNVRCGKWILINPKSIQQSLSKLIPNIKEGKNLDDIFQNINRPFGPIDTLLAKIIFTLDILDTPIGISNLIIQVNSILNSITISQAEYTCRPVSAIIAFDKKNNKYEGDCIETLYRHLLNIAIQDPGNLSRFHIERLPNELQGYYVAPNKYPVNTADPEGLEIVEKSEAGLTNIENHTKWKNALKEWNDKLGSPLDISKGSLINIANTLNAIAFHGGNIPSIDHSKDSIRQHIQNAMNKLAALKNKNDERFSVTLESNPKITEWDNERIVITDNHARRKITVGICEDPQNNNNDGHAEILKIELM